MPKDSFVRKQNSCNFRLGELTAPLQRKAMELDRSLNWLVCDMLKSHPYLKEFLDNKNNNYWTGMLEGKDFNRFHSLITTERNTLFSEEEIKFLKDFAGKWKSLQDKK